MHTVCMSKVMCALPLSLLSQQQWEEAMTGMESMELGGGAGESMELGGAAG